MHTNCPCVTLKFDFWKKHQKYNPDAISGYLRVPVTYFMLYGDIFLTLWCMLYIVLLYLFVLHVEDGTCDIIRQRVVHFNIRARSADPTIVSYCRAIRSIGRICASRQILSFDQSSRVWDYQPVQRATINWCAWLQSVTGGCWIKITICSREVSWNYTIRYVCCLCYRWVVNTIAILMSI